jgi:hypothetical protein
MLWEIVSICAHLLYLWGEDVGRDEAGIIRTWNRSTPIAHTNHGNTLEPDAAEAASNRLLQSHTLMSHSTFPAMPSLLRASLCLATILGPMTASTWMAEALTRHQCRPRNKLPSHLAQQLLDPTVARQESLRYWRWTARWRCWTMARTYDMTCKGMAFVVVAFATNASLNSLRCADNEVRQAGFPTLVHSAHDQKNH